MNYGKIGFSSFHFFWHVCVDIILNVFILGVAADKEMFDMVRDVFGNQSKALLRMKYHMYWIPKFKNRDPNPVPKPLPNSELELAKIIINRICRDPANITTVYFSETLPDVKEDTWLVSGQSPHQIGLIQE